MTPKCNLIKVKEVCSVCTKYILIEQEILGIIIDLQNGKASDIPIVTSKVARTVISPYLTTLYNSCFASGIFPKVLKISNITPIYNSYIKKKTRNLLKTIDLFLHSQYLGKFLKNLYIAEYIDF